MAAFRIVGGPLPHDVKVFAPDGQEITKHVIEISFAPITPNDPVRADIRVEAEVDLLADLSEPEPEPTIADELEEERLRHIHENGR